MEAFRGWMAFELMADSKRPTPRTHSKTTRRVRQLALAVSQSQIKPEPVGSPNAVRVRVSDGRAARMSRGVSTPYVH